MTLAAILDTKITLARRRFFVWRFRHRELLSRLARGLAYAFGRSLSEDDRHCLRIQMNESLGYYPLMTLATTDVLQTAQDIYGEEAAAKLQPYLDAACDRVASKWSGDGASFGFAVDWALEKALDYAASDGIKLTVPL